MKGKVQLTLRGVEQILEGERNSEGIVEIHGLEYHEDTLPLDIPKIGTVYGTLLNFKGMYEEYEPLMNENPYKSPPKAPILYIKPKNTQISHRQAIPLPKNIDGIEMNASLGLVIGKTATKVLEKEANEYIHGYTIVNDVTIPHQNIHRPAIKEKARDGFCPIGPWITCKHSNIDPNDLLIKVYVNDKLEQEISTKYLCRSIEKLVADVTEFMTLYKGDVLLVGTPEKPPYAKLNDLVRIEIEGIGKLENRVIHEEELLRGDSL